MTASTELVAQAYGALATRDLGALERLVDPEVEIRQTEALPWGGRWRGPEGFRDFVARLFAHIDSQVQIERLYEAGEEVVAVGRTRGTARASGRAFDVPFVHVWRVEKGRIRSFHALIDTPAMREALGG